MKVWKGISLFFIYPVVMLGIGFLGGIAFMNYFYPGRTGAGQAQELAIPEQDWQIAVQDPVNEDIVNMQAEAAPQQESAGEPEPSSQPAASVSERLTADTSYVLEETDIRSQSVVETTWRIPDGYIGMTRDQFLDAMEEYESFPPLSELERGFVSLEVLSFSSEKVVVQMNYEYTQPSSSFYLKVENNLVVVYLDDQETVYMYTDILLTDLPDRIQQDIINMMFIQDEESLYDFLENYSS